MTRTIIPNAIAEPPSERSVFGEPARPAPQRMGATLRQSSTTTAISM